MLGTLQISVLPVHVVAAGGQILYLLSKPVSHLILKHKFKSTASILKSCACQTDA